MTNCMPGIDGYGDETLKRPRPPGYRLARRGLRKVGELITSRKPSAETRGFLGTQSITLDPLALCINLVCIKAVLTPKALKLQLAPETCVNLSLTAYHIPTK